MVLISVPVENWHGFLNYITYIGMGKLFPILISTYIVIYGTPRYGDHHFSLGSQHFSEHPKTFSRKPKWGEDLIQTKSVLDLDAVILAINCASAATSFFEEQVLPDRPALWFNSVYMLITFIRQLLAVYVASISTFIYIILQLLHLLLSFGSESWTYVTLETLFVHTWRNIRVQCCQILYCPIFLHNNDSSADSCRFCLFVDFCHQY